MKMYELTDAYARLVVALDDCESEEQAEAIISEIDAVSSDMNEKANNYAMILKNIKADAD